MASRRLEDLHPHLRDKAHLFLAKTKRHGVDALIYCTWRSPEEQAQLYAQGRTKPGKIVTRAKAGQSSHNHMIAGKPAAKAFDAAPMKNGQIIWDERDEDWQVLGKIASELGLEWYGRPNAPFHELCHFELR